VPEFDNDGDDRSVGLITPLPPALVVGELPVEHALSSVNDVLERRPDHTDALGLRRTADPDGDARIRGCPVHARGGEGDHGRNTGDNHETEYRSHAGSLPRQASWHSSPRKHRLGQFADVPRARPHPRAERLLVALVVAKTRLEGFGAWETPQAPPHAAWACSRTPTVPRRRSAVGCPRDGALHQLDVVEELAHAAGRRNCARFAEQTLRRADIVFAASLQMRLRCLDLRPHDRRRRVESLVSFDSVGEVRKRRVGPVGG
jgi:hypothetical protein